MMRLLAGLFAGLLALPAAARAVELPVTYRVEMDGFHRHVHAGTPMRLTLYADPACTARLHSEEIPAGELELLAERQPTREAPSAPPSLLLLAVLDVTSADGPLFLQLEGDGVSPRGSACQTQDAGMIESHLDETLGVVFDVDAASGEIFSVYGDLLFEQPDCRGRVYSNAPLDGALGTNEIWGQPQRIFVLRSALVPDEVQIHSRIQPSGSGRCENTEGRFTGLVEAEELPPAGLVPPSPAAPASLP
ncbi:MAG: hypothetical protein ACE5FG_03220 [Myxococcota bacterium]